MSKLTAQERLDKTRARVRHAIADAQATLRAAEAAAKEEARRAHRKHLWRLARLLDETGLSAYQQEELAPHFTALAARLSEPNGVVALRDHETHASTGNGIGTLG